MAPGHLSFMPQKVAILLDGGFVKKKITARNGFVTVAEITELCRRILSTERLAGKELFRIYYYDAPPFEGTSVNPISGERIDFSSTPQAERNRRLIDALELQPDFAVRRGEIFQSGWKLGRSAMKNLVKKPRAVTGEDLVPDMVQKGVDIRIGLDIAWISLKRVVDVLVLVTGDSDFVPVTKFARKEGIKVYLDTMDHPVRRELKAHVDLLLQHRGR